MPNKLFYIEDNDQQSLHSVFKSLSNSLSENKLETLNSLLEIFILQGEDIDGSLVYSVNLGINSYDKITIKNTIFDNYFIKLFQVLDLLYSNFSDDNDIEPIFYYFPITEDHKCFGGSFERLERTFLVLNNKSHQSVQSSVEFNEELLDKMTLKHLSAIQMDHNSLNQEYEIHAKKAFSVLTMTESIDKINESGSRFSANLIEQISFDQAIKIFKEYRIKFSSFLSLNLQNLFEDIIKENDELYHYKIDEILENYKILNKEIFSKHESLLPNINDFYDLNNYGLFEKSKIIDNYKERVKIEIEKFTQLISKIPDSAYSSLDTDNWNDWSRWIDDASIDNKDLLMHIISLTSLNLSRLYIDGEDHAQNTFISKFKDKIFSQEILTKLFTGNASANVAQLILSHHQQGKNLALLDASTLTTEELLVLDILQRLDNLKTSIDISHITEITHKPKDINEFLAVLNLLTNDNIKQFTGDFTDEVCYEMFLYFCRSLSSKELEIILDKITDIDAKIDYRDHQLIEYFTNSLFPSSLTLLEEKYLEFIIKNVDELSIKVLRTALSYVESKENYDLLQKRITNIKPKIQIEITDQNIVIAIHNIEYNFSDALIHKFPSIDYYRDSYKLAKVGEDIVDKYSLIELAINIQDKKFLDSIIDYMFDRPDNLCYFLDISDEKGISIITLFKTLEHQVDQNHQSEESEIKASSFRTYTILT